MIITRHGKPVVEFKPLPAPAEPVSEADLDWLTRHRLHPDRGIAEYAGSLDNNRSATLKAPSWLQPEDDDCVLRGGVVGVVAGGSGDELLSVYGIGDQPAP